MDDGSLDHPLSLSPRLTALEARLARIETLLERSTLDADAVKHNIQAWVTDYVSLRLQQLVPETCDHPPAPAAPEVAAGPVLPGTAIRCTEDVVHRLARIPIPFVRQMVTEKVAETARAERIDVVDVAFFERAATF